MNRHQSRHAFGRLAFLLLALTAVTDAHAQTAAQSNQYRVEFQFYQILTDVKESGPTSRTLPGMEGWLQVIHQRLDNVDLVMEGGSIAWNGTDWPDNSRITLLAAPEIVAAGGEDAEVSIASDSPVQYLDRKENGDFELKETDTGTYGIHLALKLSETAKDGVLDMNLSFEDSWIRAREEVEGVRLNVGKPVIGHAAAKGTAQIRLKEWSCLRVPLESEGWMYVFMLVSELDAAGETPVSTARQSEPEPVKTDETPAETSGPKIEVGGSIQIRAGHRSGGGR